MKKWFGILFMVSFFLAAGAFYYEGAPEKVAADEEQVNETDQNQQETDSASSSAENTPETVTENTPETVTENKPETVTENKPETVTENKPETVTENRPETVTEDTPEKDTESSPEAVTEDTLESENKDETDTKPATSQKEPETTEQSQENTANTETEQAKDTIKIGGVLYVLVMDENEYPNLVHLIDTARKYNAKLYGIPNSDVFAFVKDGNVISHYSVGGLSVLSEHAEFAKIFLSGYKGIGQNIDFVIDTKAKVTVEWSSSAYYSVAIRNGWIEVYYN